MRTRYRGGVLVSVLLLTGWARGQLSVDCVLDQGLYVVGEPVRAEVRIINFAATPLVFGPSTAFQQNRLVFEIRDTANERLQPLHPDAPLIPEYLLPPGESHTAAFELDEWYPLARTGRFIATAVVRRDDRRYESKGRSFDVVPGLEICSAIQLFADRPNEQRKLSLVYVTRRQGECLFLRITDSPGDRVWSTLQLGQLLRTTRPAIQVQPDGVVTVTHRASRDIFIQTRVLSTAKGVTLTSQEQIMDEESKRIIQTQQALLAAEQKEQRKKDRRWWWPFGGSDEKK